MPTPDLVKRVRALEESTSRWKTIGITALSLLGLVLVAGAVFGTLTYTRLLNAERQLAAATDEANRQRKAAEDAQAQARQDHTLVQQLLAKDRPNNGELRQPTPAELRQAEEMAKKLLEGLKP